MTRDAELSSRFPRTNAARAPERWYVRLIRLAAGLFFGWAVLWNFIQSAQGLTANTLDQSMAQFTNLSSLFLAFVLILGALQPHRRIDHLRGAAAFYLVMTGINYYALVAAPGEFFDWQVSWTNITLHRIAPFFALIEWLAVAMRQRGSRWRPVAWLAFPLAYLFATWIRGAFVDWYPYDFLDPSGPGGWGHVAQWTGLVLAIFLAFAVVIHLLGNLRARLTLGPNRG